LLILLPEEIIAEPDKAGLETIYEKAA